MSKKAKLRKGFESPGVKSETSLLQPVESGYEGSQKSVITNPYSESAMSPTGLPHENPEGKGFGSEGAEEMSEKFAEFDGRETAPEEVVTEETTEQTQEADEIQPETDTSAAEEVAGDIEGEEYTEQPEEEAGQKTVSLDALHEEREKRKALRKEVDELKEQNAEILGNYGKLAKQGEETAAEYSDMSETEQRLSNENKTLKDRLDKIDNESSATKQERERIELNDRIKKVDAQLEADGFPGFSFMVGDVTNEIERLIMADPENSFMGNDEVSWKKIYKAVSFPKIKGKFDVKNRNDKNKDKIELKSKANLVGTPGKKSVEISGEDKPYTYDDYKDHVLQNQLY